MSTTRPSHQATADRQRRLQESANRTYLRDLEQTYLRWQRFVAEEQARLEGEQRASSVDDLTRPERSTSRVRSRLSRAEHRELSDIFEQRRRQLGYAPDAEGTAALLHHIRNELAGLDGDGQPLPDGWAVVWYGGGLKQIDHRRIVGRMSAADYARTLSPRLLAVSAVIAMVGLCVMIAVVRLVLSTVQAAPTATIRLGKEAITLAPMQGAAVGATALHSRLTLRPRYGHGSLEDTYRATIRTVVVSEAKGPRRSARRALAELTTALRTYTLAEPGQEHPTPLVPISRAGSVLRVIAGVVFLAVVGWTLVVPVVRASLPLLPDRFMGVVQLVDHVRPWLIGLRRPSPPVLLGLGLLVLTAVVMARVRARRAPPARRLVLRAPRTPVPRVLTPWAWWHAPLTLHAAQLGQLYHLPTARLGTGVRWLLHRIIHPQPLAFIPLDELLSGRWLPLGYGVRPDGSEGLVGMLMRSARETLAVAAPPGTGKTRFVLRIFAFVRRVDLGIFGMDGKGDDLKGFVGKARRMVRLEDEANLVLLDPTDAWTISLNPLLGIDLADELGVDEALGQIERIFVSVDPYTWTKSTRMPGVLRKVMQLVLASEPLPTIAHGKQVLDDPAYRARLMPLCREHNSEVASFWDAIERGDDTIPEATLSGLRSRFDALLDTRSMRPVQPAGALVLVRGSHRPALYRAQPDPRAAPGRARGASGHADLSALSAGGVSPSRQRRDARKLRRDAG